MVYKNFVAEKIGAHNLNGLTGDQRGSLEDFAARHYFTPQNYKSKVVKLLQHLLIYPQSWFKGSSITLPIKFFALVYVVNSQREYGNTQAPQSEALKIIKKPAGQKSFGGN